MIFCEHFSRLIYNKSYLNLFRSYKKNKLKNFRIFCQNIVRSKKGELYLNLWRMKKKFWPFRDCFRSLLQASLLLSSLVVLYIVCHATTFQCLAKNFFLPQHIDLESQLYFQKVESRRRLESAKLTKSMVFQLFEKH